MAGVLSDEDEQYIVEKAVQGFSADEIVYLFNSNRETPASESTIRDFLDSEDTQERVELVEDIRDKKAEVTREEIISDLRDMKDMLQDKVAELKDSEHGKTFNESVKNLQANIESLAKMIGELEEQSIEDSVIYVNQSQNFIQENVFKVAQHLPDSEKVELVEDLSEEVGLEVRRNG